MKQITVLRSASLAGLLAVAFGAFGAHGLKNTVDAAAITIWDTAARYQFYHALALLAVSLLMLHRDHKLLRTSALFFVIGIVFFSGSLYLFALRSITPFDLAWLGPVTPLGGLSFIIGWICLFLSAGKIVPSEK